MHEPPREPFCVPTWPAERISRHVRLRAAKVASKGRLRPTQFRFRCEPAQTVGELWSAGRLYATRPYVAPVGWLVERPARTTFPFPFSFAPSFLPSFTLAHSLTRPCPSRELTQFPRSTGGGRTTCARNSSIPVRAGKPAASTGGTSFALRGNASESFKVKVGLA